MQVLTGKMRNNWPLRKKMLLSMLAIFMLLSLSAALITHTVLFGMLKEEFKRRGLGMARGISANSVVDVLTQNSLRLKQSLQNEKNSDRDIAYAFISDSSGRVLAHTFDKRFPVDLAKANDLGSGRDSSIKTLDTQLGLIYDIAVPVSSEKDFLGQVRLGVLQKNITRAINAVNIAFICAAFFIILIGAFLTYRVSFLITEPISKLVEAVHSIQGGDFSAHIEVKAKDEVGELALAFNEMTMRLKNMMEEVKRLSVFEERNRIALDLHDGRAQDLADIIKRIELCEKLFKIEPDRAFQELNTLRENTRAVLDRTRKVIFNIKSAEDSEFDLLDNVSSFVKDFEKKNDIMVMLEIPDKINIPPAKQKAVFCIIAEAFSNIKKHALAKKTLLSLKLEGNNTLTVNIKDDGRGFDVDNEELRSIKSGKLGLIGMRERTASLGGTLVIDSTPQKGTTISISVSLT